MSVRAVLLCISAFVTGALVYSGIFVVCLGSEQGSALSASCSSIGFLLKAPLLYVLPYSRSSYWGIDTAKLFMLLNVVFWGMLASLACMFILRWRSSMDGRGRPKGA